MTIKHVKGQNNVVADAISRFPMIELLKFSSDSSKGWYGKIMNEVRLGICRSRHYKVLNEKLYYNPHSKNTRLTNWNWKLVIPEEDREAIIKECHDDPRSAHLGIQKTIDRVLDRYYWPGL